VAAASAATIILGLHPPLAINPQPLRSQPGAGQRGGLGKAHQLFGAQLNQLLEELNQTLAA